MQLLHTVGGNVNGKSYIQGQLHPPIPLQVSQWTYIFFGFYQSTGSCSHRPITWLNIETLLNYGRTIFHKPQDRSVVFWAPRKTVVYPIISFPPNHAIPGEWFYCRHFFLKFDFFSDFDYNAHHLCGGHGFFQTIPLR